MKWSKMTKNIVYRFFKPAHKLKHVNDKSKCASLWKSSIATNPPMRILGNEQVTYHVIDLQNSVDAIIAQIFSQNFQYKILFNC